MSSSNNPNIEKTPTRNTQDLLMINQFIRPRFMTMSVCYYIIRANYHNNSHNNTHNNTHNHKHNHNPYPTPTLICLNFYLSLNSFKILTYPLSIPDPKSFKKPNPPTHQIKEKEKATTKGWVPKEVLVLAQS